MMNEIIQDTKITVTEYVGKIPNGCKYISQALRSGKIEEGLEAIGDFTEGMHWLINVEEYFKQLQQPFEYEVASLGNFLNDINEGLQSKEYLLVADLFEYEIAEYFLDNSRN